MKMLNTKAFAKINLSIDILGTLPGGYHEISTVMQQISLHDEICVKWAPEEPPAKGGGIRIEIGSNKGFLPTDDRNIAYKAIKLVAESYGISEKYGQGRLRVDIKKQIPVGAGLGGGSADAAAVLRALSKLWELSIGDSEMRELGARLGADVAFCIMGQTGRTCALAEGRGEKLATVKGVRLWAVLSKPPISVSTAEAYKGFDRIENKDFVRPDTKELILAMENADYPLMKKNMINVLENFTLKEYPDAMYTKNKMISETSPIAAVMSGSGPTIIGLYRDEKSAEDACRKMASLNRETYLAKTMI